MRITVDVEGCRSGTNRLRECFTKEPAATAEELWSCTVTCEDGIRVNSQSVLYEPAATAEDLWSCTVTCEDGIHVNS